MDDVGGDRPWPEAPVAVVTAMSSEARHVLEDLNGTQPANVGPWHCWSGTLAGRLVLAQVSGIGMVNAAAGLSALLAAVRPRAILNVGCAGAHRADILPGDVVVANGAVAYGSITVLADGSERFAGHRFDVGGVTITPAILAADRRLLEFAAAAARDWHPAPWITRADREPRVHFGIVASADCWTQQPARIERLHARHNSLCEDMEAAALAQVAAIYGVPFLAIKDVSNNEFLGVTEHGPLGPTLDVVGAELGRRAWALARRILAVPGLGTSP